MEGKSTHQSQLEAPRIRQRDEPQCLGQGIV
jgi:hypothetical protein